MLLWLVSALLLLFSLLPPVAGSIDYVDGEGGWSIPFYSVLLWNQGFREANVTLVSIVSDRALFDYCDLASYTPHGISPLLASRNIGKDTKWMAVLFNEPKDPPLFQTCAPYVSVRDNYSLRSVPIHSLYVQRIGATGKASQLLSTCLMNKCHVTALEFL
jgi:hypothetical protein